MALLSAAKRLFIPNKNMTTVKQPEYGNDMRAIEVFNPINKLVAGSGVTLTPSDGSGPEVEIAASGGGSAKFGYIRMISGPDSAIWPFFQYLGPSDTSVVNTSYIGPLGQLGYFDGTNYKVSFAASWFCAVNGGQSVNFLPSFGVPVYTASHDISAQFFFEAEDDATFGNTGSGVYTAAFDLPSGFAGQVTVADLTAVNPANGDLSLVSGTGESGNGLVSAAGDIGYFGSVVGTMVLASDIVFT